MPGGDAVRRLLVCGAEPGSTVRQVAENVAPFGGFSFSGDGRYLAYAMTPGRLTGDDDVVRLGSFVRSRVVGDDGKLAGEFEDEEMAGYLFNPMTRVCCLRDGRILFPAAEVQLPCVVKDMPQRVSLFALAPDRRTGLTRLMTREAEAAVSDQVFSNGIFEVSPDEKRLTLPAWGEGSCGVYTFATGEVKGVLPKRAANQNLGLIPTWRTADELCVAVPAGSGWGSAKRAEIVLWSVSTGVGRCISRDWPDELVGNLLEDK